MKILIFFAGTGSDGSDYYQAIHRRLNHDFFNDDVLRIFLTGCQHSNIGNSILYPDLTIGARKLRAAFNKEQGCLDLNRLKDALGTAIYAINGEQKDNIIPVEKIGLVGFSRGAISCFKSAQHLNELDIPIDLFVNQPITGEKEDKKPLFEEVHDLSACHNIQSTLLLLGAFHNQMPLVSRLFHSQMIPLLPQGSEKKIYLQPLINHQMGSMLDLPHQHSRIEFAEKGYLKQSITHPKTNQEIPLVPFFKYTLQKNYEEYLDAPLIFYTPRSLQQTIYGNRNAVEHDIYYQKTVIRLAAKLFGDQSKKMSKRINFEQALSILFLDEMNLLRSNKNWLSVILNHSEQSRILCHFISEFNCFCNYLFYTTQSNQLTQSDEFENKLNRDLHDFKKTITILTAEFVQQPSEENRIHFMQKFKEAAQQLRESSLDLSLIHI